MDTNLVTIPKEQPKAEPQPEYREATPNWAEKEETVGKFLAAVRGWFDYFDGQAERQEFRDLMTTADRMFRVSQKRDESSTQKQDTLSNVTSTSFFRRVRRRATEMKSIILGGEEDLPVQFYPLDPADKGTATMLEAHNAYLRHVMEVDGARAKMGQSVFYGTKYGVELVSLEWDYQVEDREVREVVVNPTTGKPVAKWKTVREDVANHPTLLRHDLKDVWFDARIADMQKQRCILKRDKAGIEQILGGKVSGNYVNTDKVTAAHLYQGEGDETTLSERKGNAGQTHSDEPDGLFRKWEVWMRAPINDKGEWDADRTVPRWCWATFIGEIEGSDPVCVRLNPNPYKHKHNPFKLLHTHDDDVGAYSMGLVNVLACNYEEECTTINQAIDNKTLRNRKPWIVEKGSILTRDMTFGANKVIHKRPGAPDPKEIEVQDTTANALQLLNWVQTDGDRAAVTEGAMEGRGLGARASASEAKTVFDQQIKPMVEDAMFFADQLLPWYAETVVDLARQYLDPDVALYLNVGGMLRDVQPEQIYKQARARIVSVREYEKNAVRRLEENNLLSVSLPAIVQLSPTTAKMVLKQVYRNRKFEGVEDWFGERDDSYEAMEVAKAENDDILFGGILDIPKADENHEAHLKVHKPMLALYGKLPKEQQNEANRRQLEIHAATHEYYAQRGAMQAQSAAGAVDGQTEGGDMGGGAVGTESQPATSGSPAAMEGTAMGDMAAGAAGGMNA